MTAPLRVVVVGTGVVGAAAAYRLARDGARVVVVDPAPPGRSAPGQATAAGAGIVFPWQFPPAHPAMQALGRAAAAGLAPLLGQLAADGTADPGFARRGALTVHPDPDVVAGLAGGLRRLRDATAAEGMGEVRLLGPEEVARRVPVLRRDLAAVLVEGVAQVDGRRLRNALLDGARRHGAGHRTGPASLDLVADRVDGVRVEGRHLPADVVVVAAGAWAAALCAPLGVSLPVTPQRGLTVHLRLPDGAATGGWPAVRAEPRTYLVALPGGRVVAGASVEEGTGEDPSVSAVALHAVLDGALAVAPGLAAAAVVETAVGLRPVTDDGLPLLGPVAGLTGLIVATGLGSQGLTYGPHVGECAGRLAQGRPVDLPLGDLRPDRAPTAPSVR